MYEVKGLPSTVISTRRAPSFTVRRTPRSPSFLLTRPRAVRAGISARQSAKLALTNNRAGIFTFTSSNYLLSVANLQSCFCFSQEPLEGCWLFFIPNSNGGHIGAIVPDRETRAARRYDRTGGTTAPSTAAPTSTFGYSSLLVDRLIIGSAGHDVLLLFVKRYPLACMQCSDCHA